MIRSATPDDAKAAIPLIVEAIGSIAMLLTGTKGRLEAMPILERFFREANNRVSYENTLVLEEPATDPGLNNRIVGVTVSYDGSSARKLDEPLERAARLQSGLSEYQIPTEA